MPALALALLLQVDGPGRDAFDAHIRALASDEMKGRDNGTEEGLRAADYVAARFKEYGLKPAGKDGYAQDFVEKLFPSSPREHRGRNVVGLVEGESREYVVVAAHHDGQGVVDGKVRNGADDNASGVAMVLELARSFAGTKPRRSMVFVTFDCEEDGLLGSRHFVASGLFPPESIAALFVFDLIGGDLFSWEKERIYALGSESSAELHARVARLAAAGKGLEVVRASVALIEPVPGLARSDYHAFRARGIPFVFFSSGTPWYYHTEHDDPGVINLEKMEKAFRFVRGLVAETAAAPERPAFRKTPPSAEDVTLVREALARILENRGRIRLSEKQWEAASRMKEDLSALKEPDLGKLQQAMMLILAASRSQEKP